MVDYWVCIPGTQVFVKIRLTFLIAMIVLKYNGWLWIQWLSWSCRISHRDSCSVIEDIGVKIQMLVKE